jgi:UDP-N-acetylglucosamine 2-epimerase (hydrolysing)
MKDAQFMIGNSSAGIREAPFYDLPSINIGNRQNNRSSAKSIVHVQNNKDEILSAIDTVLRKERKENKMPVDEFGRGNSASHFLEILEEESFWQTAHQKQFQDKV